MKIAYRCGHWIGLYLDGELIYAGYNASHFFIDVDEWRTMADDVFRYFNHTFPRSMVEIDNHISTTK